MRCTRFAVAAVWLGLVLPAAAGAQTYYLRQGLRLDPVTPIGANARTDVSQKIGSGDLDALPEFTTFAGIPDGLSADTATATLFLVTGKAGMASCADVIVDLTRRTAGDVRVVVATGSIATSILPRRDTLNPIVVTVPVGGVVIPPGERLGLAVSIRNRCGEARTVTLLHDAAPQGSRVAFHPLTGTPTTTVTTTTGPGATNPPSTTTTTVAPTTTTLPPPLSCFEQPLVGFAALLCRLDVLDTHFRAQPQAAYGGARQHIRLQRRIRRARIRVVSAREGGALATRRMRKAGRILDDLGSLLQRGVLRSEISPVLGDELQGLVLAALTEARSVQAGLR